MTTVRSASWRRSTTSNGRTTGERGPRRSLDAAARTRQLLVLLDDYVEERRRSRPTAARVRFKQREVRDALGWSDFTLRKHLARLIELEYVLAYRTGRGNEREYELLCEHRDGDGPAVSG